MSKPQLRTRQVSQRLTWSASAASHSSSMQYPWHPSSAVSMEGCPSQHSGRWVCSPVTGTPGISPRSLATASSSSTMHRVSQPNTSPPHWSPCASGGGSTPLSSSAPLSPSPAVPESLPSLSVPPEPPPPSSPHAGRRRNRPTKGHILIVLPCTMIARTRVPHTAAGPREPSGHHERNRSVHDRFVNECQSQLYGFHWLLAITPLRS